MNRRSFIKSSVLAPLAAIFGVKVAKECWTAEKGLVLARDVRIDPCHMKHIDVFSSAFDKMYEKRLKAVEKGEAMVSRYIQDGGIV